MAVLPNKKPAVEASQRRDSSSARVDPFRTADDPAFAYRHGPGWHSRPDSRTQRRVGSSRGGMSGQASWSASPVTRYRQDGGKSSSPGRKGRLEQLHVQASQRTGARPARISAGPAGRAARNGSPARAYRKRREPLLQATAPARRTARLSRSLHEELEPVITGIADILVNRHLECPS